MEEHYQPTSRKIFFYTFFSALFLVFLFRLAQLQILYQDEYGKKSEENSIRALTRDPIRGLVFDRHGILLVDNRPSYTVTMTPAEFDTSRIAHLSEVLHLDVEFINDRLNKGVAYNRLAPVKIKRDIDFRTLSMIEENRDKFPGVHYQVELKRYYPTKARASHLFGYTKEVSDVQVSTMPDEYRPGDIIGASGLEARYERALRGVKGFEFITVNARGQLVSPYNDGRNDISAKEGDDLSLALDGSLQAFAESLLANRRGAIVALDPNDGGVLALVSKPDFDLTAFGSITPTEVWNALNYDSTKPLFNRATLTRYPPGSTFKMVLAAAALQDGVISPQWGVNCTGAFQFGSRVFKDLHVHGPTNLIESIQRSCNVFYYQLMLKTGFDRWTRYGREFGFGSPTNIDIFEENSGLLPSEEYFNRVYGEGKWTQGYLISLAIGQGELGVSPVQMACYAMVLANKGHFHTPHVVQRIRSNQTGELQQIPFDTRQLNISNFVWDLIREGLYRCVNAPGGTAPLAKVEGVNVAGKTGTAQNPHGKDHAWFIGFAPFEQPKIAICVLVENAGFGGVAAAPIAGLCIEQYLYRELIRNKPIAPIAVKANEHGARTN
ncbi:MAG: penicillin-binding protein 2 [Ignavibacteriae bacterium]|nr:penicillin-binding protein 2 [Ignavibacteriota bacterium]